tara:strand:- start:4978 stop:5280 length:303 start_codon:yes stop_codon:yes gene_type:complete
MNTTTAKIFSERPVSTNERAKLFANALAARSKSARPSPTQSPTSSFDGIKSTTLHGDLVNLKEHLDGFEARLHEPCVGQIMDTSMAAMGDLYHFHAELRH